MDEIKKEERREDADKRDDESRLGHIFRTSLTGRDNKTFDVARISFALVITGWFVSLMTFLVLAVLQYRSKGILDGFAAGVGVLFGTLTGVMPCAAWAVNLKASSTGGS